LRMRQISIETWKFPEEITRCSWLLYIFECLFNLYNFFARDVKCTLRFQCIEHLVCVWTAIEYYNLDTNKKTLDTLLNLQSCLPIVPSLTALSNAKQVRIWVQTEISSMLIQLTYILYKYGWFKMFSSEFSKLLSIDMIIKLWKCRLLLSLANAKNNFP
jgi:hypothetical protein